MINRPFYLCLAVILFAIRSTAAAENPSASAADAQASALGQSERNELKSNNTHPDAQWFPNAGLGLFIHWGIASIKGEGDLSWCMLANKPWHDYTITPNAYYGLIKEWRPDRLDFDRTLAAAKAAGFNYAVFTTKHHDGFTMWPTDLGDVGTRKNLGGRDFVKEFVDACRKHGLKVGLYYSPPDWRFDRDYRSWAFRGPKLDMDHKPAVRPPKPEGHDAARAALVSAQVTELLTRYGKIDLIWFDGGKGEISNDEVRRLQPGIIINGRNKGPGDYADSEGKLPRARPSRWFEACVTNWPIRKWSYSKDYGYTDAPTALTMVSILRAWGANLLANVGPRGDGSVPQPALDCWTEMAAWMKHSGESVRDTTPGPWPQDVNLPVTRRPGAAYVHFLPNLPEDLAGLPPHETTYTKIRQIIQPLPGFTDTLVWKNCPKPARAFLLRSGAELPFHYENQTLTLTLPSDLRSGSVDVVKLLLDQEFSPRPAQSDADRPMPGIIAPH
ncbi:MAG: hypothetical protein RLZZ50_710 [Verrucomicrobiota bacterium]